jgi:hypothetical protein
MECLVDQRLPLKVEKTELLPELGRHLLAAGPDWESANDAPMSTSVLVSEICARTKVTGSFSSVNGILSVEYGHFSGADRNLNLNSNDH